MGPGDRRCVRCSGWARTAAAQREPESAGCAPPEGRDPLKRSPACWKIPGTRTVPTADPFATVCSRGRRRAKPAPTGPNLGRRSTRCRHHSSDRRPRAERPPSAPAAGSPPPSRQASWPSSSRPRPRSVRIPCSPSRFPARTLRAPGSLRGLSFRMIVTGKPAPGALPRAVQGIARLRGVVEPGPKRRRRGPNEDQ